MIEIQIAGAGAGKTYGLARSIVNHLNMREPTHKKIYALTYTNSAKRKIESEITNQLGNIPTHIEIQTIHTFLLNEIVYPFSDYVLGNKYKSCSTTKLSDNIVYKNIQIRQLNATQILHADQVYDASRRCIDESMTRHNTKSKKQKVRRVLQILSSCIDKIFLDEAQDLDETGLNIFEILGTKIVNLHMVGDPKQAIKYPQSFSNFIEKYRTSPRDFVTIMHPNNQTRRVPNAIVQLSNKFCYEGQEQISISTITGSLSYIQSTHPQFKQLMKEWLSSDTLIYIDKTNGLYSTRSSIKSCFPPEIQHLVLANAADRDPEIFLEAAQIKFFRAVQKTGRAQAIQDFLANHNISYSKKIYAQLLQCIQGDVAQLYNISSIDAVKGLEADTCIFIISQNTYNYLIQKDLSKSKRFNKEWKKIYVALTRSKDKLILVIDHAILDNPEQIITNISRLGFTELPHQSA